jgi:hypothetical protein
MNSFNELYALIEAPISDYISLSKKKLKPGFKTALAGKALQGIGSAISGAGNLAGKAINTVGNVAGKTIGVASQALGVQGKPIPGTGVVQGAVTGAGNIAGKAVSGTTGIVGGAAKLAGAGTEGIASIRKKLSGADRSRVGLGAGEAYDIVPTSVLPKNRLYSTNELVTYKDKNGKQITGRFGGYRVDSSGNSEAVIIDPEMD